MTKPQSVVVLGGTFGRFQPGRFSLKLVLLMRNKWHDRGDHFAVELWSNRSTNLNRAEKLYALVDAAGLEIMQSMPGTWGACPSKGKRTWYVRTTVLRDGRRVSVSLHRLITNCPEGLEPDHLNHDGLDNRLANLKVGTHRDNAKNRRAPLPKTECAKCGNRLNVPGFIYCAACMIEACGLCRGVERPVKTHRHVLRSRNYITFKIVEPGRSAVIG